MNQATTKIQKTSRAVSILLLVLEILLYVVLAVAILAIAVLALNPGMLTSLVNWAERLTSVALPFAGITAGQAVLAMSMSVLSLALMAAVLYFARRVFRRIATEYTPFTDKNVKDIRIISWLMLAVSLVPSFLENGVENAGNWVFRSSLSLEFNMLIFAVIFFCLAQVFAYGCALQKQSDETL